MQPVLLKEMDLSGGLMLVGLPSFGVVGGVAANYLIETLGLELVGSFHGDELPAAIVVQDGLALGVLQIYASEIACGPDGKCTRLVLVKGDLPIPPHAFGSVADKILAWAEEQRIAWVVALEGTPSTGIGGGVRAVASVRGMDFLTDSGLAPLSEVIFSGFSAALLLKANRRGSRALALLTATEEDGADARAAARLLGAVDPMLPHLPLGPEDLLRRATEIESRFRAARDDHGKDVRKLMAESSSMYA